MYKLIDTKEEYIDKLIEYKLRNILDYAVDLIDGELEKIHNYVNNNIPKQIDKYKLIELDNKIIGCVLVVDKDDGIMLDEIYIEKEYRGKGIGTNIITNIINNNNIVYLWVYKLNEKAIKLYKKLGFNIILDSDYRYYMKYEKQ